MCECLFGGAYVRRCVKISQILARGGLSLQLM